MRIRQALWRVLWSPKRVQLRLREDGRRVLLRRLVARPER